jgi:hypothetical protein
MAATSGPLAGLPYGPSLIQADMMRNRVGNCWPNCLLWVQDL